MYKVQVFIGTEWIHVLRRLVRNIKAELSQVDNGKVQYLERKAIRYHNIVRSVRQQQSKACPYHEKILLPTLPYIVQSVVKLCFNSLEYDLYPKLENGGSDENFRS